MSLLIVWGAGGHGKVVCDSARSSGAYQEIVFVDDNPRGTLFHGLPVIPATEAVRLFPPGAEFVIAVGDNDTRARLYDRALAFQWRPETVIHRTAVLSPSARIGPGTVVLPLAVINAGAEVGCNSIVNTGAIVEHDCRIGNHAHLSPRVAMSGAARVGNFAHLGTGAILLPSASVGDRAIVGAGAVVLHSVPDGVTAVGIPAKPLYTASRSTEIFSRSPH